MNNANDQKGISSLGLLMVLAVAGFVLLVGFKVGPLYLDNYFVKAAIDSLEKEDIHEMSDGQVRRKLSSYFTINNVRDIDTKGIKVIREKTRTLVQLDYEKRVNLIGNLDVVVTFHNQFDSSVR